MTVTAAQRKRILARDFGRCFYCLRIAKKPHIEHRLARVRGGTDEDSNLVVSCASCNLRKARYGPEWAYHDKPVSRFPKRKVQSRPFPKRVKVGK